MGKTKKLLSLLILFELGILMPAVGQMPWTLKQCIDTAIANNLNLKLLKNSQTLSRINLEQSKNNLLPSINGTVDGGVNISRKSNALTNTYEPGADATWTSSVGITATQNLFSGLQMLNAIKQSELIYKYSQLDVEDLKFNLTISIVNAYLQVLYADQGVKIAVDQTIADSAQLQTTENLLYVGKRTESDRLQIKSQLANDNYQVVSLKNQLSTGKLNLQQLMNVPVDAGFTIDESPVEPAQNAPEDISSIYQLSLASQPIIKSYELRTKSAAYSLKIAKGAYYPQLQFKTGLGTNYNSSLKQYSTYSNSTVENIGYLESDANQLVAVNVQHQVTTVNDYPFSSQLRDNLAGTFALSLRIPILNYYEVRNNVKKQQVNVETARLNEQVVRLNLRQTIEQVYTNVLNSSAQYQSAQEETEAARAAYEISMAKFNEGLLIPSDLIIAENSYNKARFDLLQAKYGLLFNLKILDYYKGIPVTF